MPSYRKKKRPVPGVLGWAFFVLFVLSTMLAFLWVIRPVLQPKEKQSAQKASPLPKRHPVKPIVAIIIDDMGQNPKLERQFFRLGIPLTFSFLPHAPYTKALAREAHIRGFEVMVHLPLEAKNHSYTPDLIRLDMPKKDVKYLVKQAIIAVPYAGGVNHHMGSLFTTDRTHVRWVLEVVREAGLFYVDSRTTKDTVVPIVAKELGIPFAERNVFLDHDLGIHNVEHALELLVKKAQRQGHLLAIGHPHPETLKVLKEEKYWLMEEVSVVPASQIVNNKHLAKSRSSF